MKNEEIRLALLKVLYDKYFQGQIEGYFPTSQVINFAKLENEDQDIVLGNVDYIAKEGLVDGVRDVVTPYPINLTLQPYGIDYVESHYPETRDFHNNIRFRVLSILYGLHFGGHLGKSMDTTMMAKELMQFGGTIDELYGDITYLERKGFIFGNYANGTSYPFDVKIQNPGIDLVDSIVEKSLEDLQQKELSPKIKSQIEEIQKQSDKKTKLEKFKDFMTDHQEETKSIVVDAVKEAIKLGFKMLSGG